LQRLSAQVNLFGALTVFNLVSNPEFIRNQSKLLTMKLIVAVSSLIIILAFSIIGKAQDYSSLQTHVKDLKSLTGISDANERTAKADKIWNDLIERNSIPIIQEDSVVFLYRGNASTVSWMGDFNGWGYDRAYKSTGSKIANTDIWMFKASFPNDARLDYKILVNGVDWIIDPSNAYQQWSGVGGGSPNSELRMPMWKADPVTEYQSGVAAGKLETDILFNSKSLGYQLTYSVYLPAGYNKHQKYPVVYITDGYEYLHERLGNMLPILNNLIAQKKIEPVIAIFIDHREPVNRSNNRRMQELAMNSKYLGFFETEFIPHIESKYPAISQPEKRAILGTAMGGLTAAYFAFTKPGIFGMSGIQSPSFRYKPEIYTVCDNPAAPPSKVYLTTGIFNDTAAEARRMKDILDRNLCTFQYSETNQGHSWGNWRDTIDDILIYFFPAK
jgi:enterochelin esterase-like enzyme